MNDELLTIRVTTDWLELEVLGEPFVELTMRGYAPLLPVRNMATDEEGKLYISASSLARKIEPLRLENDGNFAGLKFKVRKESAERTASYELEALV